MANEITDLTTRRQYGNYVPEGITDAQEAMQRGGLGFTVSKRPLLTTLDGDNIAGNLQLVKKHVAIVRNDNMAVLGIVGNNWRELQPWEMFDWTQMLVAEGLISYSNVGFFRGGARIYIQAKFDSSVIVPGDRIDKFLMVLNGYDGTFAIVICFTARRISCENSMQMAIREGKATEIRIKHTASMKDKLEAARHALGIAREQSHDYDQLLKAFARLRMTGARWDEMANVLIPDNAEAKHNTRAENARNQLVQLAVTGLGQDIPGVAGTGYAAYNAITEYANYYRPSRGGDAIQERRFESALFGSGDKFIQAGVAQLNAYLKQDGIQVAA